MRLRQYDRDRYWRIGFLVLVWSFLFFSGCSKKSSEVAAEDFALDSSEGNVLRVAPALLVDKRIVLEPVARSPLEDEVLASGVVIPLVEGEAHVGSMVSGRIAGVLVREGDEVKKGQVLVWIDAPEATRLQGEFLRSRANLWRAEQRLERERVLWEDQATSERALREAEAEGKLARADEVAARGALSAARIPIPKDDTSRMGARIGVTSPISGIVSKRLAIVGAFVGPEDNLFEIVDPSKLMVRADVPEIAARRVLVDEPVRVFPRGEKESCPGQVHSKLEVVHAEKRTMGVIVEVGPTCKGLVSGGFADVSLSLSTTSNELLIIVPRTAVVHLDGSTVVFVEIPSSDRGTFDVREVRLGNSDGSRIVVEEGLREGERIAVEGSFLLKGEHMKARLGE